MSETIQLIQGLRAAGLTQTEISLRTKIPQPTLSKWSRGQVPCSAEQALKLRALLAEITQRLPKPGRHVKAKAA